MKTRFNMQRFILPATLMGAFAFAREAHAQGGGGESAIASIIPLLLIMVIFYVLLIRPQQKRIKAHRQMVEQIRKGDKIITSGGIYAIVQDVAEDHLKVEIADGIRIKIKRDAIMAMAD